MLRHVPPSACFLFKETPGRVLPSPANPEEFQRCFQNVVGTRGHIKVY